MSIAKRCQHAFSASARQRGDDYFNQDRVGALDVQTHDADAEVTGSEDQNYQVHVDFDPGIKNGVRVTCTCLHFAQGTLCKHIWATLRQLDADGWSDHFASSGRFNVLHDLADSPNRSGQLRLPSDPLGMLFRAARSQEQRRVPAARALNWRQQLASIQDVTASAGSNTVPNLLPKEREIWFVVNLPACHERALLIVDLYQRERKRNGEFGKLKRLSVRRSELESANASRDIEILQVLLGPQAQERALPADSYYFYANAYTIFSKATVVPALYDYILERLAQTQRFVLQSAAQTPVDLSTPLQWDAAGFWELQVSVEADEEHKRWRIRGELVRDHERCPLQEPLLVLRNGLILFRDRVARFIDRGNFVWLNALRRSGTIDIPYRERKAFMERLCTLPDIGDIRLPANIALEQAPTLPAGVLQVVTPAPGSGEQPVLAQVHFTYGQTPVVYGDSRKICFDAARGVVVRRNAAAEEALVDRLLQSGVKTYRKRSNGSEYSAHVEISQSVFPELVAQLNAEGWVVQAEGRPVRRAGAVRLRVRSATDWFELDGDVDFGGVSASFPALLAALRRGRKMIRLSDGTSGLLPSDWLQQYAAFSDVGEAKADGIVFQFSQALILDGLLARHETVSVDKAFAQWREKLCSARLEAGMPSTAFRGVLRNYQCDGLGWMQYLRACGFGGCLADDMGLGKTVQVLALLTDVCVPDEQQCRPNLVVVPKSLVFNWLAEANRFAPHLAVLNYTGTLRGDLRKVIGDHDIVLTTYGTLRLDIQILESCEFNYVILDEAQAIKNADSQVAKAVRVLKARHRLAMTGTPIENHLGELWSLFDFLNPGLLSRSLLAKVSKDAHESEPALEALAYGLRPFILRRTRAQVLQELPEKTEQTLYCDLTTVERKRYDELRKHFQQQLLQQVSEHGLNRSKIQVLEALLRLRQAACHPGLLDTERVAELSSKLELLLEQLTEVLQEGHKALVFSQFTRLLQIVRTHLDARGITYEYLDGKTRDRGARVARFQNDPQCPLFLISLKAGGLGLNLTSADYVFILDPWWNPAAEAQAVDRAHRIGQTRRLFAYRLIARDTVEEKILELQKGKRALAEAIVSADNSVLRQLTVDDLALLFS